MKGGEGKYIEDTSGGGAHNREDIGQDPDRRLSYLNQRNRSYRALLPKRTGKKSKKKGTQEGGNPEPPQQNKKKNTPPKKNSPAEDTDSQ